MATVGISTDVRPHQVPNGVVHFVCEAVGTTLRYVLSPPENPGAVVPEKKTKPMRGVKFFNALPHCLPQEISSFQEG